MHSYFLEPGALTGPPRPSVYCSGKCFGGQKPGAALKDAVTNRLMRIRIERERESEQEGEERGFGAF